MPLAGTSSLRLADRNYEDRMPSKEEPAQAVPEIEYTVESAHRLAEALRAIPPKDPAKRKLDKQGMVSLLVSELVALQQRGYTFEEVAEGLRGRGLSLYRIRGRDRASQVLTTLTDQLAASPLPELQTFRRTLMRWRKEILAYFGTGLTNGRTEGFNNKAKLVKKRAYGYRSFRNYRLRLLNACA